VTRIFLRLLNAPILFFLACLAVAFQSSFFLTEPLSWIQPDILLLMIVWLALKREFTEAGVLTLLLGHLAEIHSSSPSGTLLVSYMATFLLVRLSARLVVVPHHRDWFRLTLAASVIWRLASLLVLDYLDKAGLQWRHTLAHLIPGGVATAALGRWVYPAFDAFDRATHRNLRLEQRLSDDLKLAENEGG
jgi:hypothetical protein